jgi:hypothetical protein
LWRIPDRTRTQESRLAALDARTQTEQRAFERFLAALVEEPAARETEPEAVGERSALMRTLKAAGRGVVGSSRSPGGSGYASSW